MNYFYDEQVRRYLQQFIRLFSQFSVQMGVDDYGNPVYQTVPARYGDESRMVAHIQNNNSENTIKAVPMISCYIEDLQLAPDRRTHAQFSDKVQVTEKAVDDEGNYIDDQVGNTYQVTRYQPVPYNLIMKVDVWTSNTDQKLQLLEQLLVLFNPTLNIRTSSSPIDWTSLTYVELTNTVWSLRSIPQGPDDQIDVAELQFTVPIWISPPAKLQRQSLIHTVISTLHEVDNENLDLFSENLDFTAKSTSFTVVSYNNFKVNYLDGVLTLLSESGETTDSNGDLLSWKTLLPAYGEMREGISQIRLKQSDNPTDYENDVIGTVSYSSNDNQLLVDIDTDTLPSNTLGTVDAIINPSGAKPGDGNLPSQATGQRYLIVEDIPLEKGDPFNIVDGWYDIEASANDIIQFNGVKWVVVFDASESPSKEFVTNTATSDQYEWTGEVWQNSFEGTYKGGFWRIYL